LSPPESDAGIVCNGLSDAKGSAAREVGMTSGDRGSVTSWLGDLKAGDRDAAQKLWERYFDALVRLAHARLRTASRVAEDEEDAALSAFDSFCAAAAGGRFPRLDDRGDLWRVLVTLTSRKAVNQFQRQRSQKRNSTRVAHESDLGRFNGGRAFLDRLAGPAPSPEFAALLADEWRHRLESLGDHSLRTVALLRLEGFTNGEIAEQLGCGLRTVARKLDLIRRRWRDEVEG
jgi:DNA-directed RNA polymerase specialized sigma24 family protein